MRCSSSSLRTSASATSTAPSSMDAKTAVKPATNSAAAPATRHPPGRTRYGPDRCRPADGGGPGARGTSAPPTRRGKPGNRGPGTTQGDAKLTTPASSATAAESSSGPEIATSVNPTAARVGAEARRPASSPGEGAQRHAGASAMASAQYDANSHQRRIGALWCEVVRMAVCWWKQQHPLSGIAGRRISYRAVTQRVDGSCAPPAARTRAARRTAWPPTRSLRLEVWQRRSPRPRRSNAHPSS